MKNNCLALICFFFTTIASFSQTGIVWDSEIIVSDGSTYGKIRPRAAIANGTPIVVYAGFGDQNIFISRWNGTSFDTQSVLPAGTESYAANWTGPDIAAKGDTVIAVFKLKPAESGNVYVVRSIDGGSTFSDTIRVGSYTGGNHWLPSIEIDGDGNPTVAIMIHDGQWANPRQALFHSNDAGLTFGPAEEVATPVPGEACDCCPSEVVIDNNREILLFRNNENNIRDVFGVLSVDNGLSFPYSENVDQLNWSIAQCPASGMDGSFSGNSFYTTFSSNASGTNQVYVTNSDLTNGLNMVERVSMSIESSSGQNYPTISGKNDTLVVVWEERIGSNKEIFYSVSTSSTNPLLELSTVKFQANEITIGNQTNPDVIYDNGFVHLFYQDDANGNAMYRRGSVQDVADVATLIKGVPTLFPNPTNGGSVTLSDVQEVNKVCSVDGKEVSYQTSPANQNMQVQIDATVSGLLLVYCNDAQGNEHILRWINSK